MKHSATLQDTVTIHYSARTREGGVVEDTSHRRPLTLRLDDPRYLRSLREAIVGMIPGDTKTIRLEPEQVFGRRDHRMQLNIPLTALPAGIQEGEQLSVQIDEQEIDVWVVHVTQDEAVLDINHPLAGESLEYTIHLISMESAPPA
ncbi:MAG: FKBP-type peptidyl-prolyl cis-trans isomerase [Planctomycetaceae bacterium]|nr:FKBP-type peptidyl-prolyl cis-trans isomerase [Planctomycetaceae bacterium]